MCKLSKIRRLTKSGAESKIVNPLLETGVLHVTSQWALMLEWDELGKITYNTASYKLSKFIVPIQAPFTTGEFTVQNSYKFTDEIQRYPNANNYFMVSFDIENLFTSLVVCTPLFKIN